MSSKPSRKQSMATCLLCCHEIDNVKRFHTVGACGHTGCCSLCALRMRQLLSTTSCVMCKTDLPRVICVESESESFHSFQDWGDNIGPTHVFDESSGMFFVKADFPNLHKLRDPVCKKCGKNFATVAALKTHLVDVHQLQHCGICLEHKKVFLGEQELYTKDQLKRHNTKGNPKEGFSGHPRCDFCFSRFYSTTELYNHLHKNHFECDICLHSMNIQNRYYKDYNDLENHFRAEHFLCEETVCLRKKFVVFKSHLDLQAHMTKEHPHIKVSRKIDVHFTVRRATHDGAGATNDDDGFEDYEQFQRQQQQYGSSSDRNIINVADFPSLSSGGESGGSLFWENQTTTRPRMEDFPVLASGSASSNGSAQAGASFRNALAPPPTPAMLAHMNRGDAWEYPELASAAAALGANNPLMRFVKPSKMKGKKGRKSGGNGNANGNGAVAQTAVAASADEEESKSGELEDDEEEEKAPAGPEQSKSAIVLKLRQVLGSDAKYEVFREDCKAFRMAEADIPTFYAKMKALFSAEDFEKLFLKLMRLFPDKEQVDKFFAYHKQFAKQQNASQGFKESHSKKNNKQQQQQNASQKKPVGAAPVNNRRQQQQPQAAAASGWANALRETGATPSARSNGRGPAVIVHNMDTRDILGRNDPLKTTWQSTHNWQAPVSSAAAPTSAAASAELTSASTKIQTAPVDSFASLSVGTAPSGVGPSYVTATAKPSTQQPASFKKNASDFPNLPTASRPVGVQPVTRATWDDQFQTIAQNRTAAAQAPQSGGKKKQKKKSMTLAEMAMRFS